MDSPFNYPIRVGAVSLVVMTLASEAWACRWCRLRVSQGIYGSDFLSTLVTLLLPVMALGLIATGIYHFDKIAERLGGLK